MNVPYLQKIVSRRKINLQKIKRGGIGVSAELDFSKWTKFFALKKTVYAFRLEQFWGREEIKLTDSRLTTKTKIEGKSIPFSLKNIVPATECPRTRSSFSYDCEQNKNEEEVNMVLYGVSNPPSKVASKLVSKGRFLHVLLINYVMLKSGARENVSKMDRFNRVHFLSLKTVDINELIFKYMLKTMKV